MIDSERITAAILKTGVGPLALEEGAALVEAWIADWESRGETEEILAVEAGWSVHLDEKTWAVGVMDMISRDAKGVRGNEWKTTKEPSRYWTEDKWLESIKTGPQIALYALALRSGQFYIPEEKATRTFNVQAPIRIRVRAIVKTAVPMFWPKDEADGWAEFDEMKLNSVADAFRSKAEQIRGARRAGVIPWQLMGRQCTEFNRRCEVWDVCEAGKWPVYELGFDADDPAASLAVQFLPPEAKDPDAVILSSSAYQTYGKCMELGRQQSMGGGKEENLALQTGTVLHAGAAEMFRQVREQQQKEIGRKAR